MTVFGQVLAGAADIAPEAASLLQLTPPSHGDRYAPTTVPPNIPKAFAGTLTDLAAFFTYYQPAHPFLPPLPRFQELLATNNLLHVCLAMRYLGSAFIPGMRCQAHEDAVERCLFHQHQSQDGFAVWAMLLYALGLHASANPVRAFQVLQAAIDLALALGMHRRDFATTYGEACPVLEESWRRTFWELYVVDGMFAAVTQRTAFRLHTVVADVPLPCEESEYNSGVSAEFLVVVSAFAEGLGRISRSCARWPITTTPSSSRTRRSFRRTRIASRRYGILARCCRSPTAIVWIIRRSIWRTRASSTGVCICRRVRRIPSHATAISTRCSSRRTWSAWGESAPIILSYKK